MFRNGELREPTAEQLQHAEAVRSPLTNLSPEIFDSCRGHLIALVYSGDEKGTVIAKTPINIVDPKAARREIVTQIAASPYSESMYQLRQIL